MIRLITYFFILGMVRIFVLAIENQNVIEAIFVTMPLAIIFCGYLMTWLEYLDDRGW